ncbi:hypothetical protein [Sphingomonas baiyangensis]|uniref:Uncharacterized protein n=1 Tax=Sphingomonas baiyangensis TaxID=2572576 RepID=A0A4U1L0F1_9SPHN|nr:hypothetical protein [Sphingomonas baiyangensis]TKD50207.1 hypothetical protein FBR43_05140 [Sphingomonas baiyangensis]
MGKALALMEAEHVVATTMPATLPFSDWLGIGRDLFARRRDIDWAIGDWARHGQAHYRDDPQFKLMLEGIGVEPKRIDQAAKVAAAFPEHCRAKGVSFDVHKHALSIDADERLPFLQRAEKEHWTERKAHHAVVEWKHAQGHLLDDDDDVSREAVEIIRAINRASPEAREYVFDLMEAAGRGKPINEDQAYA